MLKGLGSFVRRMVHSARPTDFFASAVLVGSFCYFFGYSIHLTHLIPQDRELEILGFDYSTYQHQLCSLDDILRFPFRHPFFGVLLSPAILIGHVIHAHSAQLYLTYLSLLFAAVVSLSVFLSYKIQHEVLGLQPWEALIGCSLFSSFAYMPILAAVPESFAISMLILTATLYVGARGLVLGRQHPAPHWVALAFLAGGVTITNAVKVGLAYLISTRLSSKQIRKALTGCCALLAVGFLGYYLRMEQHNAAHPEAPKTILRSVSQTCSWIRTDLSAAERIAVSSARFFSEPILFHDRTLRCHEIPLHYEGALPSLLLGVLYSLAALSLVVNVRTGFTRLLVSMFAVDALLHLVVFWNTVEGQIFCGHWFYIVPLLTAQLVPRIRNRPMRNAFSAVLLLLALGNAIHNFTLLRLAVF